MPFMGSSDYRPPFFLRSGNANTLWGAKARRLSLGWEPFFSTVRLDTPDGDFFDVDLLPARAGQRSDSLLILSHGLEGNSRRKYMRGMADAFRQEGWDALARNCRGCSGEDNRNITLYHSGETGDLHLAVQFGLSLGYGRIALAGFSMGGNQVLKYLGEAPERVPAQVAAGIAISAPCDLEGSAGMLDLPSRRLYMAYFLHSLRAKIRAKARRFPGRLDTSRLDVMRTFREFDETYTAPLHGFASARDYWRQASSLPDLERIAVPTLMLSAADDPFLSPGCFPREIARNSARLTLEIPAHGGHVGFVDLSARHYWSETRSVAFAREAANS